MHCKETGGKRWFLQLVEIYFVFFNFVTIQFNQLQHVCRIVKTLVDLLHIGGLWRLEWVRSTSAKSNG